MDLTQPVTLDVVERRVRCAEMDLSLNADDFTRRRFLEGLNDIDLPLRHAGAISAYEAMRPADVPVLPS